MSCQCRNVSGPGTANLRMPSARAGWLSSVAPSVVDEVKVQLARSDLKRHLIRMTRACEGNSDEDTGTLEKLTSDLIVLLLSGGEDVQ